MEIATEEVQLVRAVALTKILLEADTEAGLDARGSVSEAEDHLALLRDAEDLKLGAACHTGCRRLLRRKFVNLNDFEGVGRELDRQEHEVVAERLKAIIAVLLLDDVARCGRERQLRQMQKLSLVLVRR